MDPVGRGYGEPYFRPAFQSKIMDRCLYSTLVPGVSPNVISPQAVDVPSGSPFMGVSRGEKFVWLYDHTVAYTVPAGQGNVYPTYGLTRTFLTRSGDEDAQVNLPRNKKSLATSIRDSVLRSS